MKCSKSKLLLAAASVLSFYAAKSEAAPASVAELEEALNTGKKVTYTTENGDVAEGRLEIIELKAPGGWNELTFAGKNGDGNAVTKRHIGLVSKAGKLRISTLGTAGKMTIAGDTVRSAGYPAEGGSGAPDARAAQGTMNRITAASELGRNNERPPSSAYSSPESLNSGRAASYAGTEHNPKTADEKTPLSNGIKTARRASEAQIGNALLTNKRVTYTTPNGIVAEGRLEQQIHGTDVDFTGKNESGTPVKIQRIGFYDPKGKFILSPQGRTGKMTILRDPVHSTGREKNAPTSQIPTWHSPNKLKRGENVFAGAEGTAHAPKYDDTRPLPAPRRPQNGPSKYFFPTTDNTLTEGELVYGKENRIVHFVSKSEQEAIGVFGPFDDFIFRNEKKRPIKTNGQAANETEFTYDRKKDIVTFDGNVLRTIAD